MSENVKCMEYYFDSNIYNEREVNENIEIKKLEFPKKKIKTTIKLNKYGTYIARLEFENNEISIIKNKKKNINKNTSKKIYGQYKETKKYTPI